MGNGREKIPCHAVVGHLIVPQPFRHEPVEKKETEPIPSKLYMCIYSRNNQCIISFPGAFVEDLANVVKQDPLQILITVQYTYTINYTYICIYMYICIYTHV